MFFTLFPGKSAGKTPFHASLTDRFSRQQTTHRSFPPFYACTAYARTTSVRFYTEQKFLFFKLLLFASWYALPRKTRVAVIYEIGIVGKTAIFEFRQVDHRWTVLPWRSFRAARADAKINPRKIANGCHPPALVYQHRWSQAIAVPIFRSRKSHVRWIVGHFFRKRLTIPGQRCEMSRKFITRLSSTFYLRAQSLKNPSKRSTSV